MVTVAATPEPTSPVQAIPRQSPGASAPGTRRAPGARRSAGARRPPLPDRVSLILFALAGFMAVLAVLCVQLYAVHGHGAKRVLLVRKLYRTTVVETVIGSSTARPSVSQSVSSSPAPVTSSVAPTTRSS